MTWFFEVDRESTGDLGLSSAFKFREFGVKEAREMSEAVKGQVEAGRLLGILGA